MRSLSSVWEIFLFSSFVSRKELRVGVEAVILQSMDTAFHRQASRGRVSGTQGAAQSQNGS